MKGDLDELLLGLRAGGFDGEILDDSATLAVYSTDNSIYQLRPAAVVVPASTADLVTLTTTNHRLDHPCALVARGGGTGTNGQSLTDAVVVDTRRRLNQLVSVDPEAREAVVQPGVVLGQLNTMLASAGLFFAPHVSTSTRATIGGMVATDAAGKGSLIHGRTNRHVLGLTVVLADGTPLTIEPEAERVAEERARAGDRTGVLYRRLLDATAGVEPDDLPDVPRGFTGYNLEDVRRLSTRAVGGGPLDSVVDFTRLICGSEGTLALVAEIRIGLTPLPAERHLAVLAYPSFGAAIRGANVVKVTHPAAIECLDERTIALAAASPAWPRMQAFLGADVSRDRDHTAFLLVEFESTDGVQRLGDLATEADSVAVTSAPDVIDSVWKVRADAVGLLGQSVDGRRSIAFVEDCAVPPQHLEEFVAGFRAILDAHDLSYGMFGHADVGCIHVRPALDLYREDHERLVRVISDEVAALVASFGGVLWGEHGRGFRGQYLDLDDDLVRRMRSVKSAFDPDNILNPGKLYSPLDGLPIVGVDEVSLRVHRDRTVPEPMRLEFADAFACNGNGICHHWGQAEVMCPSFKATLDPRLSPKGRADLLRSWLADPDDAELQAQTADSLRQCLSCSACAGRCPINVDIPEMKSRFLHANPERGSKVRLRNAILSRFEHLLPLVGRNSTLVGAAQRAMSPLLAATAGVVDLPTVAASTAADWPRVDDRSTRDAPTVVILPDAFTAYLEPEVLGAALSVLTAMGERPAVAGFVPSGKYDHVKGRRDRFARSVRRQRRLVEKTAATGAQVLVLEPAVFLLHHHEYPVIDPAYPSAIVRSVAEFIAARIDQVPTLDIDGGEAVQLFQHCAEVSLEPETADAYRQILEHAGFTVVVEKTSCCGMAGVFGHEIENQVMSTALFDDHWRPRLDAVPVTGPEPRSLRARCASGYSCRSQAKRLEGPRLLHPLVLLAAELDGIQAT